MCRVRYYDKRRISSSAPPSHSSQVNAVTRTVSEGKSQKKTLTDTSDERYPNPKPKAVFRVQTRVTHCTRLVNPAVIPPRLVDHRDLLIFFLITCAGRVLRTHRCSSHNFINPRPRLPVLIRRYTLESYPYQKPYSRFFRTYVRTSLFVLFWKEVMI